MARRMATEFVSVQLKLKGGAVPSFIARLCELAPDASYSFKHDEGEIVAHNRLFVIEFHMVKQAAEKLMTAHPEPQGVTLDETMFVYGQARVFKTREAHQFLTFLQTYEADMIEKRIYAGFQIMNTFKKGVLWKIEELRHDMVDHLIYERTNHMGEASIDRTQPCSAMKPSRFGHGLNDGSFHSKKTEALAPSALTKAVDTALHGWRKRRIDELLDLRRELQSPSSMTASSLSDDQHAAKRRQLIKDIDTMLTILSKPTD